MYLSPTEQGTVHDKKMADEEELTFPDDLHLFQDNGFQGYQPPNVHLVQPFKKPRKGELSPLKKWFNRYVSSVRIVVEHAISGVKRARIVKDKSRHASLHFRDQLMNICVGLHNFRVTSPFRQYDSPFKWSALAF